MHDLRIVIGSGLFGWKYHIDDRIVPDAVDYPIPD